MLSGRLVRTPGESGEHPCGPGSLVGAGLGCSLCLISGDGVPRLSQPCFFAPPALPSPKIPLNPWTVASPPVAALLLRPQCSSGIAWLSGGLSQQFPWAQPLPAWGKGDQPQWSPQLLEVGHGLPGPWNLAPSPHGCQPWGPAPACGGYPHPAPQYPPCLWALAPPCWRSPHTDGVWFSRVH